MSSPSQEGKIKKRGEWMKASFSTSNVLFKDIFTTPSPSRNLVRASPIKPFDSNSQSKAIVQSKLLKESKMGPSNTIDDEGLNALMIPVSQMSQREKEEVMNRPTLTRYFPQNNRQQYKYSPKKVVAEKETPLHAQEEMVRHDSLKQSPREKQENQSLNVQILQYDRQNEDCKENHSLSMKIFPYQKHMKIQTIANNNDYVEQKSNIDNSYRTKSSLLLYLLKKMLKKRISSGYMQMRAYSQKQWQITSTRQHVASMLLQSLSSIYNHHCIRLKDLFFVVLKRMCLPRVHGSKKKQMRGQEIWRSGLSALDRVYRDRIRGVVGRIGMGVRQRKVRDKVLMGVGMMVRRRKIDAFYQIRGRMVWKMGGRICWVLHSFVLKRMKNGFYWVGVKANLHKHREMESKERNDVEIIQKLEEEKKQLMRELRDKQNSIAEEKTKNNLLSENLNAINDSQEQFIENQSLVSQEDEKKIEKLTKLFLEIRKEKLQNIQENYIQREESQIQKQTKLILRNGWLRGEISAFEQKFPQISQKRAALMTERTALLSLIKNYTQERYFWQYLKRISNTL